MLFYCKRKTMYKFKRTGLMTISVSSRLCVNVPESVFSVMITIPCHVQTSLLKKQLSLILMLGFYMEAQVCLVRIEGH
jgi:hypothetical protein